MEPSNPSLENQPNQSQSIPTYQPSTPEQPIKQRGFLLPIVGILVILLVLAGGSYYFMKVKAPITAPIQTQTTLPTTQPLPTVVDETVNWNTYTNLKHGYVIKYPSEMPINTFPMTETQLQNTNSIAFSGMRTKVGVEDSGVSLYINVPQLDAYNKPVTCASDDECIKKVLTDPGIDTYSKKIKDTKKNILGKVRKGVEYVELGSSYEPVNQIYVFSESGKVWYVSIKWTKDHVSKLDDINKLFDQMLATFKFTQ